MSTPSQGTCPRNVAVLGERKFQVSEMDDRDASESVLPPDALCPFVEGRPEVRFFATEEVRPSPEPVSPFQRSKAKADKLQTRTPCPT